MRGGGGDGEDLAAEFGAGDPGERWLPLVFSADLEEVEEVGCAGFDGYEVLVGIRGGVGDGGDGEVAGALEEEADEYVRYV